ncbi:unnamed protein product, partial [Urochloa humidicola]
TSRQVDPTAPSARQRFPALQPALSAPLLHSSQRRLSLCPATAVRAPPLPSPPPPFLLRARRTTTVRRARKIWATEGGGRRRRRSERVPRRRMVQARPRSPPFPTTPICLQRCLHLRSVQREARRVTAPSSSSVVAASAPLPTLVHSPPPPPAPLSPVFSPAGGAWVAWRPAQRSSSGRQGGGSGKSRPPPRSACDPLPLLRTTPSRDGSTSVKDQLLTNQSSVVNKYTIMRMADCRVFFYFYIENSC